MTVKRPMTSRWLRISCINALLGLALMTTPAQAETDYRAAISDWTQILETFVDTEGRTDFKRLADNIETLDRFVAYIAMVSPASHPDQFASPQSILAYHINAYNALAMRGIIEKGIPLDFDGFFKRAGFFKFRKVVIGGKTTNLYDYENKVIRPLGDPRVHFVLNCMVRDCPRLPQEPFLPASLDAQLDSATREFFSAVNHLRIDESASILWVSEILDFYTEDFVASGRRQDLITYVNRYLDKPAALDLTVRFIPYDWTVNKQP